MGTCRSVRRAGVPGNVVDRLDKGLHVGEETDPCTEIPGGSVAVSWLARELFQISTQRCSGKASRFEVIYPSCFEKVGRRFGGTLSRGISWCVATGLGEEKFSENFKV